MSKFYIKLSKNGETNAVDEDLRPHLSITSALIESYFPLLQKSINSITNEDLEVAKVALDALLGGDFEISAKWQREIRSLRVAVDMWIDKKITPPSTTAPTYDKDAWLALAKMNNNLPPFKVSFRHGQISRIYSSNSLIPLAWAEVLYAIEIDIKARCCPYCGRVFLLPPNNLNKKTCLRPTCKMKYEIDRHGGPEGYREWERTRKRKQTPGKRPPGRPKINTPTASPQKKKVGRPRKEVK